MHPFITPAIPIPSVDSGLAGRITRKARGLTLHLPKGWPWETQFLSALARLRAIPLPA